jgi:hypothetical protein
MQFGCWTFVISISFWCPWNDINNASWSLNFLRNFYPCFYFLPLLDGDCLWLFRFEYPQPTFQKLLKEQCMEPFFVFQVLSLNHILSFLISNSEFYITPCVIFCFSKFSFIYALYLFILAFFFGFAIHLYRCSVWGFGAWMNIGITACLPSLCCLCSSQLWQRVGWRL